MNDKKLKTKQAIKTVSVNLPVEQVKQLQAIADDQHRSLSGQIAFFCALEVARGNTPA